MQEIVKSPSPADDDVTKAMDAAGRTAEEVAVDAFIISSPHEPISTYVSSTPIPPSDAQEVEKTQDEVMPVVHEEEEEVHQEETHQSPEKETKIQTDVPASSEAEKQPAEEPTVSDTEVTVPASPKTTTAEAEVSPLAASKEKAPASANTEEEFIEEIPRQSSSFSAFPSNPTENFHYEWAMSSFGRPSSSSPFTFKTTGNPFDDVKLLIAIAETQARVIQQQQNEIEHMKKYLQSMSKWLINWEREVKRKLKKRKAEIMVVYDQLGVTQSHMKQKTLLLRSKIENPEDKVNLNHTQTQA